MTGSRIPNCADTVIPIEDVIIQDHIIKLMNNKYLSKGLNIRRKGEDIKKGELLIKKNTWKNIINVLM